jgi:hypothetical protein
MTTVGCVISMALCHYSLMAAFLWLLIDIINVYQMIATVFITYDSKFLVKRVLFAWGGFESFATHFVLTSLGMQVFPWCWSC